MRPVHPEPIINEWLSKFTDDSIFERNWYYMKDKRICKYCESHYDASEIDEHNKDCNFDSPRNIARVGYHMALREFKSHSDSICTLQQDIYRLKRELETAKDNIKILSRLNESMVNEIKNIYPTQKLKDVVSGYSRVCIEWLDSISKSIQHAGRGGEFRIPCTKYRADGYDATTNTIYEFHGTFWHGHPKFYKPEDTNPITKCTFGKLYAKTLVKEEKIRELGYNLVVIWEHDYIELCKNRRAAIDLLSEL